MFDGSSGTWSTYLWDTRECEKWGRAIGTPLTPDSDGGQISIRPRILCRRRARSRPQTNPETGSPASVGRSARSNWATGPSVAACSETSRDRDGISASNAAVLWTLDRRLRSQRWPALRLSAMDRRKSLDYDRFKCMTWRQLRAVKRSSRRPFFMSSAVNLRRCT